MIFRKIEILLFKYKTPTFISVCDNIRMNPS